MTFGNTLERLLSSGYALRVRGFFNVEGGQVGVSSKFHPWCDCMAFRQGIVRDCEVCGRQPGNYVSMISGDGDGVYVVAEIVEPARANRVVGAFAIFDYQYQIANAAREYIENSQVPIYPVHLAMKFGNARPIDLGTLESTGQVYFADAGAGLDSDDAVVDVAFSAAEELRVLSFVEAVSNDPVDWAERLVTTQGLDESIAKNAMLRGTAEGQAVMEALGLEGVYELPSFIPRVLMVLSPSVATLVDTEDEVTVPDWDLLGAQFAGSIGTSHNQVMRISTIWMNALLAREYDRAAPDDLSVDQVKELLFDCWTWAYQGARLGDEDCAQMIRANSYRASDEEIADLLRRRGSFAAAERALQGDVPDIGMGMPAQPAPTLGGSNGGLTKNSNGLGVASSPMPVAETPAGGQAKFCSNCGTPFADGQARFCSSCGFARA